MGPAGKESLRTTIYRACKFSMVGVVNTVIDITLFSFLVFVPQWNVLPANILSYSAGAFNSFMMNKFWTFNDRTSLVRSLQPLIRFILINLSGLLISSVIVVLLAKYMPEIAAKVVSVGGVLIWNYSLTRLFVFTSPTN